MRLLSRRIGQSFSVAGVTITVRAIRGGRVRFCFDPPQGISIARAELLEERGASAEQAVAGTPLRPPPQTEG
jgi:carbon storage regulator CsrA